jgi:putative serine protease PepD
LLASGVGVAAGTFQQSTTVVHSVERVVDTNPNLTVGPAMSPREADVVAIAQALRPAIVELVINGTKGSGVIFRSDGYVLTNNHLIEGGSAITAILANGHQVRAQLVGGDPETDVAVVKLEGGSQPATLGTATTLKVGQMAVAIGSPLGTAAGPSLATGVVSALGYEVDISPNHQLLDMIQTDVTFPVGLSGGALVDSNADVIGIATAVITSDSKAPPMGLAIPIDVARNVADQLITTGHVTYAWLGVEGQNLDTYSAGLLKIDGGALSQKDQPSSPAARAGLLPGDVITNLDGQPVMGIDAVVVALRSHKPGDRVAISYERNGKPKTVQIPLVVRPTNQPS